MNELERAIKTSEHGCCYLLNGGKDEADIQRYAGQPKLGISTLYIVRTSNYELEFESAGEVAAWLLTFDSCERL